MALLCAGVAGDASASLTISTATLNGASSVTVSPGVSISATVTVAITSGSEWESTQSSISAPGTTKCTQHSRYRTNGTFSETFTITAPTLAGTYNASFVASRGGGCDQDLSVTKTLTGGIVVTAPTVSSIVRVGASPGGAASVSWTVTFSRAVTGVAAADFALVNGGLGGTPAITGVVAVSTSVYTVTAGTGSGSGTLGLNLVDDDTIRDTSSSTNRLGGTGVSNGNFTGAVYTIDRTAPAVTSVACTTPLLCGTSNPTNAAQLVWTVTFSESVTGVATNNFSLAGTATSGASLVSVTGSGTTWTVTANTGVNGTLGIDLNALLTNIKDAVNLSPAAVTATVSNTYTVDKTAPTAGIACATPALCGTANPTTAAQVIWNVTFSESVTGVAANNFVLSGSGTGGASIASVSGSGTSWTVTANTGVSGTLGLNLSQNLSNIKDTAGNSPVSVGAAAGNTYTVDATVPTYDAVEVGKNPATPIFTKRSGSAFSVDLLALNAGVVNTASTATVTASVVNGLSNGSCGATTLAGPATFTYTGADAGRKTLSFNSVTAVRDARIKLTAGAVTSCSSDNFAIRPSAFGVTSVGANADAAGAGTSATPALKAGTTTFQLDAVSVDGYNGTVLVNQNRIGAPAGVAGTLAGNFNVATGTPNWTASGTNFAYSEVGYFRILSWGVYDNGSFADVDRLKGTPECFTDSAIGTSVVPLDPNLPDVNGKYGCYFGGNASSYFGRFIPDHFAVTGAAVVNRTDLASCSASAFTYLGEQMTSTFTLTAQNGANATTANYTGSLAKLNPAAAVVAGTSGVFGLGAVDAAAVRTPFPACGTTPAHPCFTPGAATGSFSNGVAANIGLPITVHRGATPVAPYPSVNLGIAPVDSDNVAMGSFNLDTVNVAAGANNHVNIGATALRYGRIKVDNAYGSELLNLGVRMTAQYWRETGFVANALDNCTLFPALNFSMNGQAGGINTTNMNMSHFTDGSAVIAGVGKIVLTKPTTPPSLASKGSVTINSLIPYLPGSGRATFGLYKSGPVIYIREVY